MREGRARLPRFGRIGSIAAAVPVQSRARGLPRSPKRAPRRRRCPMPPPAAAFGCNTYSYTLSSRADDCLEHLVRLGFREFELMMVPGHLWPPEVDAAGRTTLRRRVEALGASIVTLNMPNIDMNVAGIAPE